MFEIRVLRTREDKQFMYPGLKQLKKDIMFFNPESIDHRSFVAAFDQGTLVGLVALTESSWRTPGALGLAYVSTHRQHRQRGVATELVEALFQFARAEHKNISNTGYEDDGVKWLRPLMHAAAGRHPDVQLIER